MASVTLISPTYPFNDVQIKDESAGRAVSTVVLPLHKPLFPLRAAKGRETPYWCTGTEAIAEYGTQTFDQYEKFWRNEQYFLNEAIFPNQACLVWRMVPEDATSASSVLECQLYEDQDIPQYKRDASGNYIYDEEGKPIPELDGSSQPLTNKGVKVKYVARMLNEGETISTLEPKTTQIGGANVTSYPIVAFKDRSRGNMGNKDGFKMYIDNLNQDSDLLNDTGSILWTFAPVSQPYNSNIANPVTDKYGYTSCEMVMKPNQLDSNTNRRISAEDTILRLYYNETNKEYILPFDVHFYNDNVKLIGDKVVAVETTNADLTDGWMVDILNMKDLKNHPYYNAIVDTTSQDAVLMNNLYVHYLNGGSDGDTSDEKFEELFQQALAGTTLPEIFDTYHYPITHLYDVGYDIDTKYAMASFMGTQKRCKIVMAAQDSNRHLYNMDEAVSVAAAIRSRCAITPESVLYGTQAMRAIIFGQAGYVNDTSVKNIIPMTFWSAMRRAQFHNAVNIKDSWTGNPNNVVNIYRDDNFTPYNGTQKQILWDGAANYFQWRTMTTKFIASTRSIFKDQTSLLSDDEYTDACVYLMYICDFIWTLHTSRRLPWSALIQTVQKDIGAYAYQAFGNNYTVDVSVYQTEDDKLRHDTCHIDTILYGSYPKRSWYNTIVARSSESTTEE